MEAAKIFNIYPCARINLPRIANPNKYVWAVVMTGFEAELQELGVPPSEISGMRTFLAMQAFSVMYEHYDNLVQYPKGTLLSANHSFLYPHEGFVKEKPPFS